MRASRALRAPKLYCCPYRPYRAHFQHRQHVRRATTHAEHNQTFVKRNFSLIIWSCIGSVLGTTAGFFISHTLAPPALPAPGTHEDNVLVADLERRIEAEFKVKVLRGKCLGVAKQLRGEEGGWVEIVKAPASAVDEGSANDNDGETQEGGELMEQLKGARGLGVERLFWDRGQKELVAIVWFGGSLCGWPGNAHGGVIGTVLTEKLALAASLSEGDTSDVLAAATPQRLPGTGNHAKMPYPATKPKEPVGLSLSYAKPTHANQFFVIRVSPSLDLDQERGHMIPLQSQDGPELDATMETMDGTVCVKARGTFTRGSNPQKSQHSTTDAVKDSYADFKEWLWPSRQRSSQMG